jgi:membrane-bound lytic murein transglycosylase A
MVHHTMNTNSKSASKDSSKSKVMTTQFGVIKAWAIIASTAVLASCAVYRPLPETLPAHLPVPMSPSPQTGTAPAEPEQAQSAQPLMQAKSRWVPVAWSDLPGFAEDRLGQAWGAKLRSCERPAPALAALCPDIRRLASASEAEQRQWLMSRMQPYRVESHQGEAQGLLTSYFEPVMNARRQRSASHSVPLYRPPADLSQRKPWFTRQEIDSAPPAQAALRGREIAWLSDPIDAMLLHIQGSGRLLISEPDGSQRLVRVAFAGSNEQPYRSVNQWLLDQGVKRINPWPEATKDWAALNPQRVNQLLWSNPRYVFFREEVITDPQGGPRGAQGVALSAGRSIAVDRQSIPYGTLVWLASSGPAAQLQRLVVAQDTGSAIVGPVRADYFAGTGDEAGRLASRVNQPLRLWVLWPR